MDGPPQNERRMLLRAIVPDPDVPSKLAVGPRFLPNSLRGPYWIVAVSPPTPHGEDDHLGGLGYDWAVISGGQPAVPGIEPGTCRPKPTRTNARGLALFPPHATPPSDVTHDPPPAPVPTPFPLSPITPCPPHPPLPPSS